MNRLPFSLVCLGLLAAASTAGAVTLQPLSYSMVNGGGQASGGSFNYWDAGYTGSGNTTQDGALLTGGLGKLTDGVVATQRWDAVSNNAGTGQYVGWREGAQTNPILSFTFAPGTVIDEIDLVIDNSQYGGVYAPSTVVIDGSIWSLSVPVASGVYVGFGALNLTGTTHTVQLNQLPGTWVFVSEVIFKGTVTAVPEPASALLAGLGVLGLLGLMQFRKARGG